jgi:hypothetical protein
MLMLSVVVKIDLFRLVVAHCLKSFTFRVNVYEHQGQSRKSEIEINILKHTGYDYIIFEWNEQSYSYYVFLIFV